ncbi:MAG: hypothetical protein M1814_006885 [Vezdaea aestivalis]|nr:MAG: hypothetical protein M1814_006885 [Vezdaea aestivalis]
MVSKIRTQESEDDKLIDKCRDSFDCGDCESPTWKAPSNNVHIHPSENTIAIIIDVRDNKGAIFIHEKEDGKYVDGVGTEETGNLVIVPWNNNWYYYSIGSVRLAWVERKEN